LAAIDALGARIRPAYATTRHLMSNTNDLTPVRLPCILSPPALSPRTSTKRPALRLPGLVALRFAFRVLLSSMTAVLFLLIGGVSEAEVYKWVDEAGRVHYGDHPPQGSDAQSVAVPAGPSQQAVEPARPQLHEMQGQSKGSSKEPSLPKAASESSQSAYGGVLPFDGVACFSPLSDAVKGPAAETFTAIAPTSLTGSQQESLRAMFSMIEAHWRGRITDVKCTGDASAPTARTTHFEADAAGEWVERRSIFTLETKLTGEETRSVERLTERFEVGDALYFSDYKSTGSIALEGNKVELLEQNPHMASFLIKRWLPTGSGGRLPHAEIRRLDISDDTLRQTELYYYGAVLTGRRTWVLNR
jgi:hypothetical protein